MAEKQVATDSAPAAAAPSKKGKVATTKSKAVESAVSHPSSAKMVLEAVTKLEEKGGSSLQAIKKYIAEVHKADVEKLNAHIKKAVKKLVDEGKLAQTTGKGAAGSFKLAPKTEKVIKEKKPAAKKVTTTKAEKTAIKPKKTAPAAPKTKPKKKVAAKPPTTVAEKKGKKVAAPKEAKSKTTSEYSCNGCIVISSPNSRRRNKGKSTKSSSGTGKGQKKVAPKRK